MFEVFQAENYHVDKDYGSECLKPKFSLTK